MHEKLYKNVSQNYLSCIWSWPKSILFVCFVFSTTPSIVFLVAVKKCVIPLSEPNGWITGHEIGFKKLMYSGRPKGCITHTHTHTHIYIYRGDQLIFIQERVNFYGKIDSRSCKFCICILCIYRPIDVFDLVLKFLWNISQTLIFDLSCKI